MFEKIQKMAIFGEKTSKKYIKKLEKTIAFLFLILYN